MCSGQEVSGSFYTDADRAEYQMYIPPGAIFEVEFSVDGLTGTLPGGRIFKVAPFQTTKGWEHGTMPVFDLSAGLYLRSSPTGEVTVTMSQIYGQRTDWRATVTILEVNGQEYVPSGLCAPIAPTETAGDNCAAPHLAGAQGSAADPVNTATGNFHQPFSDISIRGRGPGLHLSHAYNSLLANIDGPLGFGWTHSYGPTLEVDPTSGVATIHQETGADVTFHPDGSGGFEASPRVDASLVEHPGGTYTLKRCNTTTIEFSDTGQLLSITDRNGYATTLQYVSGKLSTVTDSAGRKLHSPGRDPTLPRSPTTRSGR